MKPTIRHLPLLLSRHVTSGELTRHHSSLLRLVNIISVSPNHPSSLNISKPLCALYFHLFPSCTTFFYNLLIRAFSKSQHPKQSFFFFLSLVRNGFKPDKFTFPSLIKACSKMDWTKEGEQTHAQVVKHGFVHDIYVINTLINMYSAFHDTDSARKVFDYSLNMVDVVSCNTILDGYIKSGELKAARKMFDEMPVRDCASWNSMMSCLARQGLLTHAKELFDKMPVKNTISWNSIISCYAINGEMDFARELFDEMPERDLISWTSIISGYSQNNRYTEALNMFKKMKNETELKPNELTMLSVLSSCAHLTDLEQGKYAHFYIEQNHMDLDNEYNLGAGLIDMYAKCGCVQKAKQIFNSLKRKNISSWNALITGLGFNGFAKESINAFEEMKNYNMKPNDVTFLGLLTSCAHNGLINEGKYYFNNMLKAYKIEPNIKHYGCMVDLLGRAGLLEESEDLIKKMPIKPDVKVLGAFLGACQIHKNVDMTNRIKREILELTKSQSGCHILVSNIYTESNRWADSINTRSLLKKRGIKKQPGSSSVKSDLVCF